MVEATALAIVGALTSMTDHPCGEIGRGPVQLLVDWLRGGGAPDMPHWRDESIVLTQSGRAAIALALRLWGICEHDEALVPAYNCGSEISPIVATGAKVSMYRVDCRARIDIADLLARITRRTRLIYITHYFGRPTETGELVTICRQRKIKLLEDCALSLFSGGTGTVGDAAIFSLRKSLPAFDGGVLLIRNTEDMPTSALRKPALAASARGALTLLARWSQGSIRRRRTVKRKSHAEPGPESLLPDLPASYYCPPNMVVHGASRFATGLLRRTAPQEVVLRRRENYAHLRRRLSDTANLTLVWKEETLDDGMCPLGLPILVEDKQFWCDSLNAAQVAVSPWWIGCHRGMDWNKFPEALALKSQLILLPVHQGLTTRHMEYIARVVNSLPACGDRVSTVVSESQWNRGPVAAWRNEPGMAGSIGADGPGAH